MKTHIALLLAGLALSSAVSAAPATRAAAPLIVAKPTDNDRIPATVRTAFRAAFGKDDKAKLAVEDVNGEAFEFTFRPVALIPLGPGRFALFSVGNAADVGHSESGNNAVHYLTVAGAGYRVTGKWFGVGSTGTFGNGATSWASATAFAANPVLYTEGGGTWQGYTCSWGSLTELTPAGPREMASLPVGYDDSGAKEQGAISVDAVFSSVVKGKSFTVILKGLKRAQSETWLRDTEGHYALAGGRKSAMPTC